MHPQRHRERYQQQGLLSFALAFVLAAAFVPFAAPTPASAQPYVFYVDDDGDNGNLGTLESPWRTIEFAIAQMPSVGGTINVLPGAYEPDPEQDFPIHLPPGVVLRSTDGPQQTLIRRGASLFSVIDITNATWGTAVIGFTISGSGETKSPAVRVFSDSSFVQDWPLIDDCRFQNNDSGVEDGGAIACEGAMAFGSANPLIRRCTFHGNSAKRGGAIYCGPYSGARISDNQFAANGADDVGGAVYVDGNYGSAEITGNRFVVNYAAGNGGGAVRLESSNGFTFDIAENVFDSNHALRDGGAVSAMSLINVNLDRNVFVGNSAGANGGAFHLAGAMAQLPEIKSTNNLYAKNVAEEGGVLYFDLARVTMVCDTVVDNAAGGGMWPGVYLVPPGLEGSFLGVTNCIFGGHLGSDVSSATISYSLVEDTDLADDGNTIGWGVHVATADFFDPLANDYRLKVGSRGIDEGDTMLITDVDNVGTVRPQDGDGDGTAVVDVGYWERPDLAVGRIAGSDRYRTAADLAMSAFDRADTVVLASGEDFPDALSAAGLCGVLGAPLLLTGKDSLPAATEAVFNPLDTDTVYIVGGTGAVSQAVEDYLDQEMNAVIRIAGSDRYDTSAEVARQIQSIEGGLFARAAFFARGDEFPDALAAAPLSYTWRWPIMLVRPTSVPGSVDSAVRHMGVRIGTVLGGEAAVSSQVKSDIDGILTSVPGGVATERWEGADRYATAATIAENGTDTSALNDWTYVGMATGTNFPDALVGGVVVGEERGVVLLTRPTVLPSATRNALAVHGDVVGWCTVFGGPGAVDLAVDDAILEALGW